MASIMPRPPTGTLKPETLGHAAIDSDHAEIAKCWFQATRCRALQFPFLIARLKKLMRAHFAREAAIMAQHGNALCACHTGDHDSLVRLCDEAARLGRTDTRRAQALLRQEFPRRVRNHIICMDQILVMFINTNGAVGRVNADCRHG